MADAAWEKSPGAKLDYSVSWVDWLESGETISNSAWTVPDGLTKVSDTDSGGVATVWLSGGVLGTLYTVTNTITTSTGRIDSRVIRITITIR